MREEGGTASLLAPPGPRDWHEGPIAEAVFVPKSAGILDYRPSRPDIPRDLESICLKCIGREPGLRYADAGELAGDLERFLALSIY